MGLGPLTGRLAGHTVIPHQRIGQYQDLPSTHNFSLGLRYLTNDLKFIRYSTYRVPYVVIYAFIIKQGRSYSNMNFNQAKKLLNSPLLIQKETRLGQTSEIIFSSRKRRKTGRDRKNWLFDPTQKGLKGVLNT